MTESSPREYSVLKNSAEKLRHELDRWMDVAWSQGERALDAVGLREASRGWMPPVNVLETTEEIRVCVDLPSVDPETIDVTLAGNMLTVSGERPACEPGEGETMHLQECPRGKFSRSIPLPASADPSHVFADADNGVLRVTIAKSQSDAPTKIRVTREAAAGE